MGSNRRNNLQKRGHMSSGCITYCFADGCFYFLVAAAREEGNNYVIFVAVFNRIVLFFVEKGEELAALIFADGVQKEKGERKKAKDGRQLSGGRQAEHLMKS